MNETVVAWLAKRRFNRIDMVAMIALVVISNHGAIGIVAGIAAWIVVTFASVFCELEYDKQLKAEGKEPQ